MANDDDGGVTGDDDDYDDDCGGSDLFIKKHVPKIKSIEGEGGSCGVWRTLLRPGVSLCSLGYIDVFLGVAWCFGV